MLVTGLSVCAQQVSYVGHRGASYLAPENTLASIRLAWDLNAPAAECDVMLTKDNRIIVFHDKKGKRLTGNDFVVKESDYEAIKNYPVILRETNKKKYQGATIPLLAEVLGSVPENKTLVIEIKTGPEILPFLEKVINDHWKTGNIVFIAFDFETILATKELYPGVPCYYLSAFRTDIKRKFKTIKNSDLDGVNLRHKIISKKLVQRFNKHNKEVWCWTVNRPEDAQKVIEAGVTAITTDKPAWLSRQMKLQN